ncbi:hypothetical protein LOK49_LG02G02462 [Camellia lanceoleosa]|uniref:Uncharacterized protein n=1 Tax=Camellia lanceoleosa TaxID=1840588 RepID=A0ACC0IKV0_9ERIC|nr:hypothetical protein LOK49_LG02G02462 [Camellia lanceoleosa]
MPVSLGTPEMLYNYSYVSTCFTSIYAVQQLFKQVFTFALSVSFIVERILGVVGKALFRAHVEGQLKNKIMSKPELFVDPDLELSLVLLDQKECTRAAEHTRPT